MGPEVTPVDVQRRPTGTRRSWIDAAWWWGPAIALMLAISVLSSFHRLPSPPGGLSDKHVHALTFGLLAVLWCRALVRGRLGALSVTHLAVAWTAVVVYGASDEFHQAFVPGRSSDVLDLAADANGALVGVIACGIIGRFLRRRDGVAVQ